MEQDYEELPKSKSQIKRDLLELQALGKQLVELPDKQLFLIPISDKLRDALIAAKSFRHGALKRQLKYIGSLMPNEDAPLIIQALDKLQQPHKKEVKVFHQIEEWRDKLLEGDENILNELVSKFENFERQYVNQLIRNAKKEQAMNKPPKSSRLIFKYLSELKNDD